MNTEKRDNLSQNASGSKRILPALAAILLLFLGAAFVLGLGQTGPATFTAREPAQTTLPESGPPPVVEDTALNFTLENVEGKTVRLSDHLGHPVIINFWATWCAPCRFEMPALQETYEAHRQSGLVFLALNQDETAEQASAYFDELNLSFTKPLLDVESEVAAKYGIRNLPTTIFVNEEGVVTAIHRGPAVREQFEGYLADMGIE